MNPNLFWCILGIIGGAFFSLIISLFFYLKSINKKQLTYEIQTICIVWVEKAQQINGLEIKYNSQETENIFYSTLTIKNVGNTVIEKNDLSPSHPLSIYTDGEFFINKCNEVKPSFLNVNISPIFKTDGKSCNKMNIEFEYIPKKQKIICHIFHTGYIEVKGLLKDGKIVIPQKNEIKKKIKCLINQVFLIIIGMLISLILSLYLKA